MPKPKIRLDRAGMAAILRDFPPGILSGLGGSVAANVDATASGESIPVRVSMRTASGGRLSARPAVDITMAHPAAQNVEAKRGPLASAAGAAGLQVKGG